MNKNDLIDALVPRLGDRAAAALAVEALVDAVLREVAAGGTVGITGFGTFEVAERAPRTGRNPHTGQAVPIPATRTPRFRPGTYFKTVVADPDRLPDGGLAGARVGSAEDEGHAAGPPASGPSSRSGAPPTVRRSAAARKSSGDPGAKDPATGTGSRRTGTPPTVRADRPAPAPAPVTEPRRKPSASSRKSIGGEQITQEMITAKKAQLARAKDDHVAAGSGAAARRREKDREQAKGRGKDKDKKNRKDKGKKKDKGKDKS